MDGYGILGLIESIYAVLDDDLREYIMWVGKVDQGFTELPKDYEVANKVGLNIRDLFKFEFALSALRIDK